MDIYQRSTHIIGSVLPLQPSFLLIAPHFITLPIALLRGSASFHFHGGIIFSRPMFPGKLLRAVQLYFTATIDTMPSASYKYLLPY